MQSNHEKETPPNDRKQNDDVDLHLDLVDSIEKLEVKDSIDLLHDGSRKLRLSRSDSDLLIENDFELPYNNNHEIENGKLQETTLNTDTLISSCSDRLESDLERQKLHYESTINKQKESHASEIGEVLNQLDSIEASYNNELTEERSKLSKKEVMTEALTSRLSEMQALTQSLRSQVEQYKANDDSIQQELHVAQQSIQTFQSQQSHYEHLVQKEKENTLLAVEEAEQQLQAEAEKQFAQANKLYVKLKNDYDGTLNSYEISEECNRKMKEELETNHGKHVTQISVLQQELDKLELSLQDTQSHLTYTNQQYEAQKAGWNEVEQGWNAKIEAYTKECAQAHQLVGTVVREKEVLKEENKELQSLCEEMMGIVESGGSKK